MADRNKIGKKYTFTWLVERGKVRELVEAIGDNNPIYRDPEAARQQGYKDMVAPPTFATVPILWTGTLLRAFDDLNMELSRIMHAEQSYEYYQEIFPGDSLKGIAEVKKITEKKGKSGKLEFIEFETIYTNQHDESVVKENMLVVERL